jgi:hypothetical protein
MKLVKQNLLKAVIAGEGEEVLNYPTYAYSQAILSGMDGVATLVNQYEGKPFLLASDVDTTVYCAKVIDKEKVGIDLPPYCLISGKSLYSQVDAIASSDANEIEEFIRKWKDPNFNMMLDSLKDYLDLLKTDPEFAKEEGRYAREQMRLRGVTQEEADKAADLLGISRIKLDEV